jgi:hypothetical protein
LVERLLGPVSRRLESTRVRLYPIRGCRSSSTVFCLTATTTMTNLTAESHAVASADEHDLLHPRLRVSMSQCATPPLLRAQAKNGWAARVTGRRRVRQVAAALRSTRQDGACTPEQPPLPTAIFGPCTCKGSSLVAVRHRDRRRSWRRSPGRLSSRRQHPSPTQAAIAAWAPVIGCAAQALLSGASAFGHGYGFGFSIALSWTPQTFHTAPFCGAIAHLPRYQLAGLTWAGIDKSILLLWPRGGPPRLLD